LADCNSGIALPETAYTTISAEKFEEAKEKGGP
jgi:hypothetical protein